MFTKSQPKPINRHLINAYYAWLAENGAKIHVQVNGLLIDPDSFLHIYGDPSNRIILNVGPEAVKDFMLDEDGLSFGATFRGQHRSVYVPLHAIESVIGFFPDEDQPVGFHLPPMGASTTPEDEEQTSPSKPRPQLKVVK
jgi:stringent starvation protein B